VFASGNGRGGIVTFDDNLLPFGDLHHSKIEWLAADFFEKGQAFADLKRIFDFLTPPSRFRSFAS
jgi:hypothetical protein